MQTVQSSQNVYENSKPQTKIHQKTFKNTSLQNQHETS